MSTAGLALAAFWATVFTAVAVALYLSSRREKRAEQTRAAHARDRICDYDESQRIKADFEAILALDTVPEPVKKGER